MSNLDQRYFITKDKSGNIVSKDVVSGGSKDAQILIDVGALEVDFATFGLTSTIPVASKDQTDWQTAKLAGTQQALNYMAKKLGLE